MSCRKSRLKQGEVLPITRYLNIATSMCQIEVQVRQQKQNQVAEVVGVHRLEEEERRAHWGMLMIDY